MTAWYRALATRPLPPDPPTTAEQITADNAVESSTYLSQQFLLGGAAAMAHRVTSGFEPIIVQNLGDSTSYNNATGIQQGWAWLSDQLPAYHSTSRVWNDTTQSYDPAVTLHTGTGGERYATLPGTSGNYILSADSAALHIVGDIDVSCKVALTDWTPAANNILMAKWAASGQGAWYLSVNTGGALIFRWSTDGTASLTKTSTVLPTVADGAALWIRATLDVDNGATGSTVTFYTGGSGADPVWVQLGAPVVTAGVTSIFAATCIPECGTRNVGTTDPMTGKFYRGYVRNGINGTVVSSPSIHEIPYYPTAWRDGEGNVWSRGGSVPITGPLGLSIYNGGVVGAGTSYFTDATRFPKLTAIGETALTVIDLGHNDITPTVTYLTVYQAFITQLLTAQPNTPVACFTQNPKLSPATGISEHSYRNRVIASIAAAKGYGLIDIYSAFMATGNLAPITNADGIHPATPDGYTLWFTTFRAWLRVALHTTA